MRSLWAVIAFELSQRRLVFLAAAVLAVLPWAVALLRPSADPTDLRLATATIGGLLFSWTLAMALGASAAGSDLSSGRMGFFYSQPLSAGVIGLGKLSAAILVSTGTLLIVTAPTIIFGVSGRATHLSQLFPLAVASIAVIISLTIGSHVISVAVRARNAWLALTAAALIVTGLVTVANYLVFERYQATALWPIVFSATLLAGIVALFLSASFQFSSGRADLRRSGRALAIATSSCLVVVALASFLYSNWAVRPTLSDLRGVHWVSAFGDGWLRVTGPARGRPGYEPMFLFRPADGTALPLRRLPLRALYPASVSSPGAFVSLHAEQRGDSWDLTLDWIDLTASAPRAESTGVSLFGWPRRLALSATGRTLAVIAPDALRDESQRLVVHEMPSGRVIAAVNLPESIITESSLLGFQQTREESVLAFDDEGRLSLVSIERSGSGYGVSRRTFALASASLSEPFWVPGLVVTNKDHLSFSANGESVTDGRALYSTRTGLEVVAFDEPVAPGLTFPLAAGALARWAVNRNGIDLQLLSSTEAPLEVSFPGATWPWLVGQLDSGELLASWKDRALGPERRWERSLWLVDPSDGTRRLLHESICTASMGQGRAVYIVDCFGNLVVMDALTPEQHTLVAGELPYHPPDRPPNPSWLPGTLANLWESVTDVLP